jgi:prepilin peptidase CpaA
LIQTDTLQWGVVLGASLLAAIWDLHSRRIPNILTVPVAVTGLVYMTWTEGLTGLGEALGACLLLALPYVVLFVFAGGGAGDAKMMGALGAWLGLRAGVVALVCVAVVGAVLGLMAMVAHRQRRTLFDNLWASLYVAAVALCSGRKGLELAEPASERRKEGPGPRAAIPYGPAIFIGVCIAAITVNLWMR